MAVKFKGTSEYKSKFKGRSARSRSASPHLRVRKAGLRSDQLGVVREPQFHSKKRVPFHRPQVYESFQWEGPEESPWERPTPRASMAPAASPPVEGSGDAEGAGTPLAPRGPKPTVTLAPPPSTEPCRPITAGEAGPAVNGVHHVLERRAGLKSAGRNHRLQSTEYQRQFQRKTAAANSPLLAAEQMVYSSSPAIPPFKVNPLAQESEYRRSFKGSPPPRAPRMRRDLEQREGLQAVLEQGSPERAAQGKKKKKKKKTQLQQQQPSRKPSLQNGAPQCGLQSQQREVRSQSPQRPRPSHGGYRKVKSEYSSRFRFPLHYRLSDGVWVKASTAAEEARELRGKAEAYRRRAWGTHFSRHHLNQILSEQNRLWEASTASDAPTERSSTICALDLASLESVRGSPRDRGSLPPSPTPPSPPSPGGRSSAVGNEGAGPQKAPAPPVRRRLAWGEEEGGAGPGAGPGAEDGGEREEPGDRSDGEERQQEDEEEEEEEVEGEDHGSDKATASESAPPSPASDSQNSVREGRLPTPKMKTIRTIQRTHHDLTTPTTGGAILVSPPKAKEASLGRSERRGEPPLGKPCSPYKHLSLSSPGRVASKGEEAGSPHCSPAAGVITSDPIPMREDAWPAYPSPGGSPALRPVRTPQGHSPVGPAHLPTNRIHGTLRDPEFQHNDDRMSQISARSAASCSMASQVLERAQKRQKTFWGKS